MNPLDPKTVGQAAESLYASGWCCSEGVLLALAQGMGIDAPCVPAVASGFCGGMARSGGMCGALTGAVIGLGLALGRSSSAHATRRLVNEFREAFGAADCHVLIGFDPHGERDEISAAFNREGRRERCIGFVGMAAELAATIIVEHKVSVRG